MDISGKNCVITGASSGLGLATSKQFARLGANVIMVCRDQKKGENAISEIKLEVPNASVELMICDLASMKSVRNFINEFKGNHSELSILFNNAGVMKPKYTVTDDGFETMFQSNYLSHFIITTSLLDIFKQSSPAIIINNGLPSHKLRLDFDDLQSTKNYKAWGSFFKTKLCLFMFSFELARKLEGTGVASVNANPGAFKSNLVREFPWYVRWIKNLLSISVYKAADNIVFLVSSGNVETKNGLVFNKKKEKVPTPYWSDATIGKRLWSATESLIESYNK